MANSQFGSLFSKYADEIIAHNATAFFEGSNKDKFQLHRDGELEIYYAPFDYVQSHARLVIVGITPGRAQAENAMKAYQRALQAGKDVNEAVRIAKSQGSFSGPMRKNLVEMLDHIGFNEYLKITSCDDIFNSESKMVHFTSALRYPVFIGGQNYNGQPDIMKTPALLQMVDDYLASEAVMLPDAIWLPLGPKPSAVVQYLVKMGIIGASQVLNDLPHPSGANAERVAYFVGRKNESDLSYKTRPENLDRARTSLKEQVQKLIGANS